MPLLKIFDDKDGNGGGQKKSDDLRAMTTIGQRTLCILYVFYWMYIYAVCTLRLVSCCIFIVPHLASVTRIERLKINL